MQTQTDRQTDTAHRRPQMSTLEATHSHTLKVAQILHTECTKRKLRSTQEQTDRPPQAHGATATQINHIGRGLVTRREQAQSQSKLQHRQSETETESTAIHARQTDTLSSGVAENTHTALSPHFHSY